MNAVVVRDVRRTYVSTSGLFGSRRVVREALRGVSLEVRRGELFGLLGPNGAGKTTLVKILATVLLPTSGSVEVLSLDVVRQAKEVRRRIGLVFGGERGLYGSLTGRDVLLFWATLYRLDPRVARSRTDELLEALGLSERANDRVWTYSRGMKQRLHLARGLIGDPEVLLLDEPTIGLDPVAAVELRRMIRELHDRGKTIFLTTHYMAEAEVLCDRVAFINEGQIALLDQPRVLTRLAVELRRVEAEVPERSVGSLVSDLQGLAGVSRVTSRAADDGFAVVSAEAADSAYPAVLARLGSSEARSVNTREPTLEDVYLRLLGERGMRV